MCSPGSGIARTAAPGRRDAADEVRQLRDNAAAYAAAYIAAAELLDCPLLTADGRLARSPGPRCEVRAIDGS